MVSGFLGGCSSCFPSRFGSVKGFNAALTRVGTFGVHPYSAKSSPNIFPRPLLLPNFNLHDIAEDAFMVRFDDRVLDRRK